MPGRASRMLAATLVLVGVTGCGSGAADKAEPPQRPAIDARGGAPTTTVDAIGTVKRAVATTRQASSAHYAGSFFFDAGPLGTDDPATGSVSLSGGTATYDVDMKAETDGLVAPGTPPDQVVLHVRDMGDKLFLQFPAAFTSAGVGDRGVQVPEKSPPAGVETPPGFANVSGRVLLAARLLRPGSCFDVLDRATS